MQISRGIEQEPFFVLIYGVDGIGKTTFAAQAPKSIIVGPEGGSKQIDVARAKGIKTYADVVNAIKWLREEKHDFQSVGLDSLDWIEPLLWADLCAKHKVDTIEEVGGGYGKGFTAALEQWGKLIASVKDLRESRGMNIIAIAHTHVKTVNDPMQVLPYDRHMLKLNEKAGAKWREAVDAVLFANFEDTVFKVNKGDRKAKASDDGGGNRKLFTVRRAAFDAKNRLGLPPSLPLSWSEFERLARVGAPASIEEITNELQELAASMKDKSAAERMIQAATAAGNDVTKLINIRNHGRVLAESA